MNILSKKYTTFVELITNVKKTQIGVYVLRLDLSCIVMCIKPKVLHKDPKFCSNKR